MATSFEDWDAMMCDVPESVVFGEGDSTFRATLSLSFSRPDLLRGASGAEILSGFCRHFGKIPLDGCYDCSREVKTLDAFVSHSWHAPRWKKYLSLSTALNVEAALAAGVIATLATFLMQEWHVLPAWGCRFSLTKGKLLPFSAWCTLFGLVASLGVFFFWQRVRHSVFRWSAKNLFLDRLCICQHDSEKMHDGICLLGAFVNKSDTMLVLVDQTYFTRLWCILEVAALHICHLKHGSRLNEKAVFLHLDLVVMVAGMAFSNLSVICSMYVCWFVPSLRGLGDIGRLLLAYCVGFGVMSPLWIGSCLHHVRQCLSLRSRLRRFHVDHAHCSVDADRVLIYETIKEWFESLEKFELFIQGDVCKSITSAMGGVKMPYKFALLLGLPWLWHDLDLLSSYNYSAETPTVILAAKIVQTLNYFLFRPVVWAHAILFLATLQLRYGKRRKRHAAPMAIVSFGATLIIFLFPTISRLHWGLYGALAPCLLYGVITLGVYSRILRPSSSHPDVYSKTPESRLCANGEIELPDMSEKIITL